MSATSKRNTTYIAAAVLIVIILAGVGYYFYSSTSAPSMTTSRKDTIVIGTTDTVQTTLDPADAYDYFAQSVIMTNIDSGLVGYLPGTTQIIPALATDWSVSPDGLTWTFNLRQGVKFADGTAFDASVMKYTIDREFVIDENSGPFAGVGIDTMINKTVASGQYQVQFVLNAPLSAFLAIVAFQAMWPVEPSLAPTPTSIATKGTSEGIVNYTGNVATEIPTNSLGPYVLTNWQRTGGKDVEIDLTANPNYWNASGGYPKTKNIIFKIYSDSTSLNLAMQSGAIDIAYRQLAPSDIKSYQTNTNFKYWEGPGAFIQYLCFNQASAPFNNVAVRQAVAAALDRSLITNTVFLGQAEPLYSIVPIGMAYHIDSFKVYGDANVSAAQSYLQSAGYSTSNPLKFTLTYPTGHYSSTDGISSAIKQALEKTGMVQVTLASEPWANYKASTQSDALQAYIYGWYPDFVDPLDYTTPFLPTDGLGFLRTHYVNPNMAALIKTVVVSSDPATLSSTYASIQQLSAQDLPWVPLFQTKTIAVSNLKVGGLVIDETILFRAYLLWETT